jgi:hypothetical protein
MTNLKLTGALIVVLSVVLQSCDYGPDHSRECTTLATVRDLTDLDGCGFVFELSDGTRLIPVWDYGWCGTPPFPDGVQNDPLLDFDFVDGKKVLVGFIDRPDMATICMAGKSVKITCLKEIPGT